MTEIDVVNYLLNKDEFFENSYNLYQDILYALQHRDYEMFVNVIETDYDNISKQMKTNLNI